VQYRGDTQGPEHWWRRWSKMGKKTYMGKFEITDPWHMFNMGKFEITDP